MHLFAQPLLMRAAVPRVVNLQLSCRKPPLASSQGQRKRKLEGDDGRGGASAKRQKPTSKVSVVLFVSRSVRVLFLLVLHEMPPEEIEISLFLLCFPPFSFHRA